MLVIFPLNSIVRGKNKLNIGRIYIFFTSSEIFHINVFRYKMPFSQKVDGTHGKEQPQNVTTEQQKHNSMYSVSSLYTSHHIKHSLYILLQIFTRLLKF